MNDDADGTPIPSAIEHLWRDRGDVILILVELNYVIEQLTEAKVSRSHQFAEVNLADAIAQAKYLRSQVERAIPYAVCPACQGALRDSCKLCKGRGAVSKFLWESPAVSDEIKCMRAKVKK